MGRFEAKILGALLIAALGPFFVSVGLARLFVEETLAVGVNEETISFLRDTRSVYPQFVGATRNFLGEQASRLAEAPEVIAVAVEAEELFGAPEPLPIEIKEEPSTQDNIDDSDTVLLLIPDSDPVEDPPETLPIEEEPEEEEAVVPVALGPLESLSASIELARALEEARQRIGLLGEVRILDAQGTVLAHLPARTFEENLRYRSVRRLLWRPVGEAVSIEVDIAISWTYFEGIDRGDGILPIYRDLNRMAEDLKSAFFWGYFVFLGLIVAIVTTLGILFARRATRRVTTLIQATQRVARGDLSTSVPETGKDEISQLARSFNQMVTDVKESRARVLYLERIGAWKDIARRLAHEIKNPLTPIRLSVQQLRSSYKGEDSRFARLVKEVDEIVAEEISALHTLVEEFSEFARLPNIVPQPEDLSIFIKEFCEKNPRYSNKVTLLCSSGPPLIVQLDKRAMRRVLLNLIKNAAEAIVESKQGDTITVTTEKSEKNQAILRITDNGPGIPDSLLEKIFEPYFTSKDTGTGIGLAIVKRVVFEHGGEISVVSPEEGGASFLISFPLL